MKHLLSNYHHRWLFLRSTKFFQDASFCYLAHLKPAGSVVESIIWLCISMWAGKKFGERQAYYIVFTIACIITCWKAFLNQAQIIIMDKCWSNRVSFILLSVLIFDSCHETTRKLSPCSSEDNKASQTELFQNNRR